MAKHMKKSENILKRAFSAIKGAAVPMSDLEGVNLPDGSSMSGFKSGMKKFVHYEGKLGTFDYDPSEWRVDKGDESKGKSERFMYIGFETNGSKIHIPEGVKDLSWTFSGRVRERAINPAPEIPDGVEVCNYTFASSDIQFAPEFPDSVKSMQGTFNGCYNLEQCMTSLPPFVENVSDLFGGCSKLKYCNFDLHSNIKDCSSMFAGCQSLQTTPDMIPDTVEKCSGMFNGCSSLAVLGNPFRDLVTGSDFYPKNVESLSHMFHGCRSLMEVPPFPSNGSLKNLDYVCASCTSLRVPNEIPHGVIRCERAYAYDTALQKAVSIPESAEPGHFGEVYLYSSVEEEGKKYISDHINRLKSKGFYKNSLQSERKQIDVSSVEQTDEQSVEFGA